MKELPREEKQRIAREYILELMKEHPPEFKVGYRVCIMETEGAVWFNGLLGTITSITSNDAMMVRPDNPNVYVTKAKLL